MPHATRRSSIPGLTSADLDPDAMFKEYFKNLSLEESVSPVSYDPNIASKEEEEDDDKANALKHKKVTVVGTGMVGMAIAYAIINQGIAGSLALVDVNASKLEGEAKDLRQGSAFHQRVRVEASTDYAVSANSHLVIITAGVAQKVGESRLSLVVRNVNIMKAILPQVLKYSPDAPICIVSNPCDIMTAVAAKIAGPSIPPGRIFGSGTCLDSSRLRSLIAKALDIDAKSVHGYIVGEHGDSSIPVWSAVQIGGVPLLKPGEEPGKVHQAMHREVVGAAGDVISLKGYTNWAVGLTAAYIATSILNDTRTIMPASTCVRGLYGIDKEVFLSLPCTLGATGVKRVMQLPLTETEQEGFRKSAEKMWEVQQGVWDKI